MLRCSRRPTHRLDQQHQAPFLTPFPVFLFSIVLSFYWVLIVSGTLKGTLDFLPTVY